MNSKKKSFKVFHLSLCLALCLSLGACSLVKRRDQNAKKDPVQELTVSKKEYDELLAKYNELLAKQGPTIPLGASERPSETIDLKEKAPEMGEASEKLSDEGQVGHVGEVGEALPEDHGSDADLNKETKVLLKSSHLKSQKKFEEASKLLHTLDKSSFKQVRVRAKYMLADIMFEQKEYDLSMQIFEEILSENAFSGYTILSLQKLSVCAKELQLEDKEKKYKSLEESLLR